MNQTKMMLIKNSNFTTYWIEFKKMYYGILKIICLIYWIFVYIKSRYNTVLISWILFFFQYRIEHYQY